MKQILYFSLLITILIAGNSCRKYVEIDEIGKRVLHYTYDYQYLLNNTYTFERSFFHPEVASDDIFVENEDYIFQQETDARAYTWADQIWIDAEDSEWNLLYKQIQICNEIIDGVMDSEEGTEDEKMDILAQAKVQRAYAYYCLVNIYAKQYDESTADTDLGVPLLLTPDFFTSLERASVKTTYNQIESDLKSGIAVLPEFQKNTEMASKTAAYGVMARLNLQKGDYELALAYADSTLAIQNTLINLADYEDNATGLPRKYEDPEIIFSKILSNSTLDFQLNPELIDMFSANDLRYQLFTDPGSNLTWKPAEGRVYYRPRLFYQGNYSGICVSEMMLVKAECLARQEKGDEAMAVINNLRQHRFKPEDYSPLNASDSEQALALVLKERRLELMGRGYRWFDQKRLNKDPRFAKTVIHQYLGENYTLEPNSDQYVFPIAEKYIVQNPELVPNPRN